MEFSLADAAKSTEKTKQKVIVSRTKVLLMLACITKLGSKEKRRKMSYGSPNDCGRTRLPVIRLDKEF